MTYAKPPLDFLPTALNPAVLKGTQLLLPTWVRWQTSLTGVEVHQAETLVRLYQAFQSGQTRFLVAFRHPSPEDGYCLAKLLWQEVPKTAAALGISLTPPVHAHFIYDRGIPLWAGNWVGWLYSRLGGTSIQRGKLDLVALRAARELFAQGQFPLAAAPEGGNNGHNEIVSPLEPGIAQLGFWCVEDLRKAARHESVVIVPLGLQYRYETAPWAAIETLLAELEQESGLSAGVAPTAQPPVAPQTLSADLPPEQLVELYNRLYRLAEHLLTLMEGYYQMFYQVSLPPVEADGDPNSRLAQRLQALLASALEVAEGYFGLTPKGGMIDRCRRLEQAGWERIFREDLKAGNQLSPVERGLADRIAEEAELRIWHMRLVETFVAVTGRYVSEKPTVDRFAETVLLTRDMIARLEGKNPFPRPQLGPQKAILTVGDPISVSDRWPEYKQNRRQAVDTLTQNLQAALENLILRE